MPAQTLTPRELAVRGENVDTRNWMDIFSAAPSHVAEALGLATQWQGPLAMVRSKIPFSHFNMVLTLGCPAPFDDMAMASIQQFYDARGGGKHWIMVVGEAEPRDLGSLLQARGYQSAGAWDRVVSHNVNADLCESLGKNCERVTADNAAEWSAFLLKCYGMPPIVGDWLHALIGRKGWIHALRREGGVKGAPVVMTRSLFLGDDGWAWLGIDAPIPGVMAPCYDDDQTVTAALLSAAAKAGAHSFVSDIEVPEADRQGPAYLRWGELGFAPVYLRNLYSKG